MQLCLALGLRNSVEMGVASIQTLISGYGNLCSDLFACYLPYSVALFMRLPCALGWIQIETRKPLTGRPSRIVREVSQPEGAKLPPYRWQIEKPISYRHARFAMLSTCAMHRGSRWLASRGFGLPCTTDVYQNAYPRALGRKGAAASASRLRRRNDVKAARAWHYARFDGDVPRDEPMPRTVSAIVQRLREAGSWRVAA